MDFSEVPGDILIWPSFCRFCRAVSSFDAILLELIVAKYSWQNRNLGMRYVEAYSRQETCVRAFHMDSVFVTRKVVFA